VIDRIKPISEQRVRQLTRRALQQRVECWGKDDCDRCMNCGTPYLGGTATLFGQDKQRRWLDVGQACCGHVLVRLVAHGMWWAATPDRVSAWQADDAKWFQTHSERTHRLRPDFPGEWPPGDAPSEARHATVVRQVKPGFRVRYQACIFGPHSRSPETWDDGVPETELSSWFDVLHARAASAIPAAAIIPQAPDLDVCRLGTE
jgi:hypothetical protein